MSEPLRINLGCGGNILPGFLNHDADVDITRPLPWRDNEVDFILCEHCAEHVPGPSMLRFLDECRRILKPGGRLRLCVPVLEDLDVPAGRDIVLNHGHCCAYNEPLLIQLLMLAGFASYEKTPRKECDGHWLQIGIEKDDLETCRLEGVK